MMINGREKSRQTQNSNAGDFKGKGENIKVLNPIRVTFSIIYVTAFQLSGCNFALSIY